LCPPAGVAAPGYAAAYARLIKWDIVQVNDTLAPAQAERALELREHLADAHGLLAVADCLRWRWEAARQDFAVNPEWGGLKSHSGFLALLRKIGLPPGPSRGFGLAQSPAAHHF